MEDSKREQTKFDRADLKPDTATFQCPACGHGGSEDLVEDSGGIFRVPDDARFIRCAGCDTLIDIGWAGWSAHEVPSL